MKSEELDELLKRVEGCIQAIPHGAKTERAHSLLVELRMALEDKWITALRNETRDTTPAPQCVCPYQCSVHPKANQ